MSAARASAAALLLCVVAMPVAAEQITVTSSADAGAGTLRAAITAANASPTATTIVFAAGTDGNAITLASALPPLLSAGGDLTISGNGPSQTIIDGNHQFRSLEASWQNHFHLTLNQLTIRNSNNQTDQGAAVWFQGGTGSSLAIDTVAFVGNVTKYDGGAIYSSVPTTVSNSTFRGNATDNAGSAISANADLTMTNCTLTDNTSVTGVLFIASGSHAVLTNVTVTSNTTWPDYAAIDLSNATATLVNVLVAGNNHLDLHQDSNSSFDLVASHNNVIGDPGNSGFVDGSNGNQINVGAPLVAAIGDFGGATWTAPLLPGSPAVDAGTAAGGAIPATDQRDHPRAGNVDVGAFESAGFTLAKTAGDNQTGPVLHPFPIDLAVKVSAVDPSEPVAGGEVRFSAPGTGPAATMLPTPAVIAADGSAASTAHANGTVGGPYNVTAAIGAITVDFGLTNTANICTSYPFPYTVQGADNAARVADLAQAIDCANANITDDLIDLGGQTLSFGSGPHGGSHGATALPTIRGNYKLTLRNGSLQRAANAPDFRFLYVADDADLSVDAIHFDGGSTIDKGGAILSDGNLRVAGSNFSNNRAVTSGGAVFANLPVNGSLPLIIYNSRFSHNAAAEGAAVAGNTAIFLINDRIEQHIDATSKSLLWAHDYNLLLLNTLIAGNQLSASGSSLVRIELATQGGSANFAARSVTVADNEVTGKLVDIDPSVQDASGKNDIFWGNQSAGLGVSLAFSLYPGGNAATQSIDGPPGFVDSANGNYQLADGSPAIDAGNDGYVIIDGLDFDHDGDTTELLPDLNLDPRAVDDPGVVDTGTATTGLAVIDMGAYEHQTASAVAGITVTPTSGLVTSENGDSSSFSVVLDRYPDASVQIDLASSNPGEAIATPSQLVFSQTNWNTPQTVTVLGLDDAVSDGDVAYTIVTTPATSSDPAYSGIDPADVALTNVDNDLATLTIGGTVTGLTGNGLVLSLNGGAETLPINGNGNFEFSSTFATGSSYVVTVDSQPSTPSQQCVVLNGSGNFGAGSVTNVVVNCGSAVTWHVGGTVSGLTGGGLALQLNGGDIKSISSNGAYAFDAELSAGASYVVSVQTQPQGQICTLANASGTISGADVTNVDVSCAARAVNLHLSVDDGHAYARYGQVRDFFVTLGNSGNIDASGFALSGSFSAAMDHDNVHWQCLGGGGGATCGGSGTGGFFDIADLPPNASITWIVSVPVFAASNAPDATFSIDQAVPAVAGPVLHATTFAPAADTDTLVIFRAGFDVPYADGTEAVAPPGTGTASSASGDTLLVVPVPKSGGIHDLREIVAGADRIVVQQLAWRSRSLVRLLARGANGRERASAWVAAPAGSVLGIGHVDGESEKSIWLLDGAAQPLQLALPRTEVKR